MSLETAPSSASWMPRLVVRQATRADLLPMEWDGEYRHFRRLYRDVYQSGEQGHALLWVVELPGAGLIAQAFVQLRSARAELADGSHRAYLYGFRVRSGYRRQGLGTYLMKFIEADLLRRGYGCLCLNVNRDNDEARRLYERLGYRIVAAEAGRWSYLDDQGLRQEVNEPAWRMEKTLFPGRC